MNRLFNIIMILCCVLLMNACSSSKNTVKELTESDDSNVFEFIKGDHFMVTLPGNGAVGMN